MQPPQPRVPAAPSWAAHCDQCLGRSSRSALGCSVHRISGHPQADREEPSSLGPALLEDARETYCAEVWAAIRSGWREAYNAAVTVKIPREGLAELRDALRQAPPFSHFILDASACFRPSPSGAALESTFEERFSPEDRSWIFDELARSFEIGGIAYEFTSVDVMRLAIEFGSSLRMVEELHELIRQARVHAKTARPFDLELLLDHMPPTTTPHQLLFCLHWLRQRGHSAQLVSPRLAPPDDLLGQLTPMAAIAMHYQARLSLDASLIHTPDVLDRIGRAGSGRIHCRLTGTPDHVTSAIQSLAEHLIA